MSRTTERLIQLLETVNPTAVNNDDGKPGEFFAKLCRESAEGPVHQHTIVEALVSQAGDS
jgi:hypothetical protein